MINNNTTNTTINYNKRRNNTKNYQDEDKSPQ